MAVENPQLFERVSHFLDKDITHWNLFQTIEALLETAESYQEENCKMAEKHAEKDIVLSDYLKTLEEQRVQIKRLQVTEEMLMQDNKRYRTKVNELRQKTSFRVYEENLALMQEIELYKEMLKEGQTV